ncbi:precorrin-3B C(17)-methyltransferase [Phormidium sp. CCY1219]|uniref:precorrin-3B C(17)-methyltransferase n=1 Tax=Phormidium sp. CCY1219 TaxID=2886104 RepID=UPI002D1F65B4|nr:precorrin-3B C(17)-methyltransferase [Phormidium sp. CCY1219]MEB3826621.1 precorrin-3B C(17)-methyltransferase [Phormidium sp. CCY1219]
MNPLIFQDFQPIAAIATTPRGAQRLQTLCQTMGATLFVPESLQRSHPEELGTVAQFYSGSLKAHLATLWLTHRAFIFCLATGAVVRCIAPLLQHKSVDPAVVVLDEAGEFAISLCSGHQGGADRLARAIALEMGAKPVLTGASTGLGLPGIDVLGVPFGWQKGEGDWTGVSAAIARGGPVEAIQEVGFSLWQEQLPPGHPFQFGFADYTETEKPQTPAPKARVWISATQRSLPRGSDFPKVQWHPRVLWVGIGCERGTSQRVIETGIREVCRSHHLAEEAIAGIATIDIKGDEVGLLQLCEARNWPLRTYGAEVLRSVAVPTPSEVVAREVGTPSVAEAAAIAACEAQRDKAIASASADRGEKGNSLWVSKQIFRLEGEPGAVTIAIARSEIEYTGRQGKLLLVGTGPGALSQMTPAAQTAISEADVVVGYTLYIDLIKSLLRPGQIVQSLPITQERHRAEVAIGFAKWGLTVAVVSSGDAGIYGMAGLVLEQLRDRGWDGKTPGVQVFPGISALQAAASRVGTPLMHDFCAISLSDLLTPWERIEKRLKAAGEADFIVALYNPRSRNRIQHIAIARDIFLQFRSPETPVAIVRSAYREDESITLTTLDKMLDEPIDMLSTVLIGNQSTDFYENWMITPRGYLGFDRQNNVASKGE